MRWPLSFWFLIIQWWRARVWDWSMRLQINAIGTYGFVPPWFGVLDIYYTKILSSYEHFWLPAYIISQGNFPSSTYTNLFPIFSSLTSSKWEELWSPYWNLFVSAAGRSTTLHPFPAFPTSKYLTWTKARHGEHLTTNNSLVIFCLVLKC